MDEDKLEELLIRDYVTCNRNGSRKKLPPLEWTDHLTECWNLSGVDHPDYRKYVREMNSRGHVVLMESQETWVR